MINMKSSTLAFVLFFTTASATIPSFGATADHLANSGFASLRAEAARIGKPEWRDVLQYAVTLHEKGTHPDAKPQPFGRFSSVSGDGPWWAV